MTTQPAKKRIIIYFFSLKLKKKEFKEFSKRKTKKMEKKCMKAENNYLWHRKV